MTSRWLGLPLLLCGACVYLVDHSPLDNLNGGDVAGRAVGVAPGAIQSQVGPLSGVTVGLLGTPRRLGTTTTGRFTLHNVPAGAHTLQLSLDVDGLPPADRLLRVPFVLPERGGTRAAVDLGDLQLLEPARVQGAVTLQGGGNLGDVRVVLLPEVGTTGDAVPQSTAVTPAPDGSYTVEGVGVGRFRVTAALGTATAQSPAFDVAAGVTVPAPPLSLIPDSAPQDATLQARLWDVPGAPLLPNVRLRVTPVDTAGPLSNTQDDFSWGTGPSFQLARTMLVAGGLYTVVLEFPDAPELIPFRFPDMVLLPGVNDLGDLFLTTVEDCGACSLATPDFPFTLPVTPRWGTGLLFTSWSNGTHDGPCIPSTPATLEECDHVGVQRTMVLPAQLATSCDGLVASDNASALEWSCDDSGPLVRLDSVGFHAGHGLADMMDWSTTPPRWRTDLFLAVARNADVLAVSPPAAWWDDPILEEGELATGPSVVVLRTVTATMLLSNQPVAWITPPGARLVVPDGTGLTLRPSDRFYLEGHFTRGTATMFTAVKVEAGRVGSINNLRMEDGGSSVLGLDGTSGIRLSGLFVSSTATGGGQGPMFAVSQMDNSKLVNVHLSGVANQVECFWVTNPSNVRVEQFYASNCARAVYVTTGRPNFQQGTLVLHDVDIQNTGTQGIQVVNGNDVVLSNVRVSRAGVIGAAAGVEVLGAARLVAQQVSISNGLGVGLRLANVNGAAVRGLYVLHNAIHGVEITNSTHIFLGEVTAVRNVQSGIRVSVAPLSGFSRVLVLDNDVGIALDGPDLLLANMLSLGNSMDLALNPAIVTRLGLVVRGTCTETSGTNCARLTSDNPVGNAVAFAPALDANGQSTTDTAANIIANNLFHTSTEPRQVWAPMVNGNPVRGPCIAPATCTLMDYGLRDSIAANVPAPPAALEQIWSGVTQPDCDSTGGTFADPDCAVRHTWAYAPLPGVDPLTLHGVCHGGAAVPACLLVPNLGAFQGTGDVLVGAGPVDSDGINVMPHSHSQPLLP